MNLEAILAEAQKKAEVEAASLAKPPIAKSPVASQTLSPELKALIDKAAKKALVKHNKKKEQKANRRKKKTDHVPKPHERISSDRLKKIYKVSGFKPMRGHYWFYEPREQNPMINRSNLSDDGVFATPFGALSLLRRKELLREDNTEPDYQKRQSSFVEDYENHRWMPGSVSQLTGFTCSYVLGFRSGWDGNAPGHRLCSQHYHTGYDDGKAAAQIFEDEGILPKIVSDPHAEETDPKRLDELYRTRGYRREGHVPYLKQEFVAKSAKEVRREKMRRMF